MTVLPAAQKETLTFPPMDVLTQPRGLDSFHSVSSLNLHTKVALSITALRRYICGRMAGVDKLPHFTLHVDFISA